MLMRARRLSSLSTTYHGASGMSVCRNISSLAREYSSQRLIDSKSIGDSLQRLMGSCNRERNRTSCSVSLTENQYLRSRMPSSISSRSKIGHWCRKRMYSSFGKKPTPPPPLRPGPVFPATVEQNDLARGWEVFDVPLEVPLGALPFRRRRKCG